MEGAGSVTQRSGAVDIDLAGADGGVAAVSVGSADERKGAGPLLYEATAGRILADNARKNKDPGKTVRFSHSYCAIAILQGSGAAELHIAVRACGEDGIIKRKISVDIDGH